METCTHLDDLATADPEPRTPEGCEECLAAGSDWVHLRRCLTCGHIGCCDSSAGKHATGHFHTQHHPVVASFQPGETWHWCYRDEVGSDPGPAAGTGPAAGPG